MEIVWLSVAIWFTANMISTISSKASMLDAASHGASQSLVDWTPAFQDLRWVDLTILQHLAGSIAVSTWVIVIQRKSIFADQTSTNAKYMFIAAVGNALGNLATNASFAAVSSSITQVIKSCEPIFTLVLTMILYKQGKEMISSLWPSVIVMVIGSCMFVSSQASFNVWGLGAALISNIAFPIRNIYLKKSDLSEHQEPLQQFAAISIYSVAILMPWVSAKYFFFALPLLRPTESILSSSFHFIYNAASITVLQAYNPVIHALLNLSKRVIVIIANIVYFATPVSLKMVMGLLIFFAGLATLQLGRKMSSSKTASNDLAKKMHFAKIFLFVCTIGFVVFGRSGQSINSKQFLSVLGSEISHRHNPKKISRLGSGQINSMTTAWIYDNTIPENTVQNIANLIDRNPDYNINVYCGTSQCMEAIGRLEKPNILLKFLVLTDIMGDTPLEKWLARHPIHKIMTGVNFEEYLHESVRLALLWKLGGIYFNPLITLDGFTPPKSSEAWLSSAENTTGMGRSLLDVSHFPSYHSFIKELMTAFTDQFPHQTIPKTSNQKAKLLTFDFSLIVRHLYRVCKEEVSCPEILQVRTGKLNTSGIKENHYGILSYDKRVTIVKNSNLGDEMQAFSGAQFLPFVDNFVERDRMGKSKDSGQIAMFFNAWFGTLDMYWPPPENIQPIMLSMHFTSSIQPKIAQSKAFLQANSPIGCRDTDTLAFFQKNGVDAYFSGCLTILTQNPNLGRPQTKDIVLVDVKPKYEAFMPEEVRKNAIRVYQTMRNDTIYDMFARYQISYNMLELYSRAKLVVTQRLHCAMPCVAMGIPVILINAPAMPGGGGNSNRGSSRLQGLTSVSHTLDLYHTSEKDAETWLRDFNWNSPPPNPDVSDVMRLRAADWNVIRKNQHLYDSARKFGMLPLSRYTTDVSKQLLFHVLLAPREDSSDKELTWTEMRSVESILRHHPLARTIIYSNTVEQRQFDVLTESGYSIHVHNLELSAVANYVGLESLPNLLSGNSILNRDLTPMLLLYRWGGVYMSPDTILVRSLDQLTNNYLLWTNKAKEQLDMSFMKFEKEHVFLKTSVKALLKRSDGASAAKTLTETWKRDSDSTPDVQVIDKTNSYVSFDAENKKDCFESTEGAAFDANMKKLKSEVFLARVESFKKLPGKIKDGTICKYLYNSFCVLCNEMY